MQEKMNDIIYIYIKHVTRDLFECRKAFHLQQHMRLQRLVELQCFHVNMALKFAINEKQIT